MSIANLKAIKEIDDDFENNASTIYERKPSSRVNTSTRLNFRPFIASREEFFKGALLAENDTEFIIRDNLFFNTNLKYSLANNFDDLRFPPKNTFPAQVRSDVKQYLKNMDNGISARLSNNTHSKSSPYVYRWNTGRYVFWNWI